MHYLYKQKDNFKFGSRSDLGYGHYLNWETSGTYSYPEPSLGSVCKNDMQGLIQGGGGGGVNRVTSHPPLKIRNLLFKVRLNNSDNSV